MIDIHTHLHPPRLFAAIRRWFVENSDWKLTQPTEPGEVAQGLRSHGVKQFVFCSYAHKPAMAEELNAWLAQTARSLDGFGLPLATVHPDDENVDGYYEKALSAGCIGLKIHEDVQKINIDDPRLEAVHALTAERGGFVLVHVGAIPFSDNTNNGPGRIASVLARHPRLNVVIAHLGVPDTLAYLDLTEKFDNLYLDTTMALSSRSPLRASLDPMRLVPYARRILFGSDYPNLPHPYEEEVSAVQALPLSDGEKRLIFEENAAKLLKL